MVGGYVVAACHLAAVLEPSNPNTQCCLAHLMEDQACPVLCVTNLHQSIGTPMCSFVSFIGRFWPVHVRVCVVGGFEIASGNVTQMIGTVRKIQRILAASLHAGRTQEQAHSITTDAPSRHLGDSQHLQARIQPHG